jgi:signal transduction histidine kinase
VIDLGNRHLALHLGAAAVMTVASLFEAGFGGPDAELTPTNTFGAIAVGVAIVLARWSPLAGLLLLLVSIAVPPLFVDLPPSGGAQVIAAMLLVGYAAYRSRPGEGLAAYLVTTLVFAVTLVLAGESVWEFVFFLLILGPAWVVGVLLRREQYRSAELLRLTEALRVERQKQAEVAVAAERTRISQELHDAVAHTVSVMTLQVGVVRRRLTGQAALGAEEETLRGVEKLGRQAVDELRHIVGLVREGEPPALAPLPSLTHLDELVDRVRSTDTTVQLLLHGPVDALPPAVDMSAYRIVQEALTNALRHAPGAEVTIEVSVDPRTVALTIRNDAPSGPSALTTSGSPQGSGLVGMAERAAVLGGSLDAEPDGAGFVVRARLPMQAGRVSAAAREVSP